MDEVISRTFFELLTRTKRDHFFSFLRHPVYFLLFFSLRMYFLFLRFLVKAACHPSLFFHRFLDPIEELSYGEAGKTTIPEHDVCASRPLCTVFGIVYQTQN